MLNNKNVISNEAYFKKQLSGRIINISAQAAENGGNQSGIPYGRGWEIFDERFLGKPLVYCGTVGRMPVRVAGEPGEVKHARPGDRIVALLKDIDREARGPQIILSRADGKLVAAVAAFNEYGSPPRRPPLFLIKATSLLIWSSCSGKSGSGQSFSPVVSAAAQRRHEAYFRREWSYAIDRSRNMADGALFILPICVDQTNESAAQAPDKFKAVRQVLEFFDLRSP